MYTQETAISELIPHRPPFVFVDKVLSATQEEIIGIKTFDDAANEMLKGSFPDFNFVPGMILIESMAQCGGAGIKLLGITDGLFGLISIENAVFLKGAEYGKEVKYVIKNIKAGSKIIKQSGVAYVEDQRVAEATWICARLEP